MDHEQGKPVIRFWYHSKGFSIFGERSLVPSSIQWIYHNEIISPITPLLLWPYMTSGDTNCSRF